MSDVEADPADPAKEHLHSYLRRGRAALLWKLEGLSGYDRRRPLVPTGTNLLGLVKHTASTEAGYLGACFGRPFPEPMPWMDDDAGDNSDMWATAEETTEQVVALYGRVAEHSDATIRALPLDATGTVPWWPPERSTVTLLQILAHMIAETHRHAGQADLVRELVDGSTGMQAGNTNLPAQDEAWWAAYRDRLEQVARDAPDRADHG